MQTITKYETLTVEQMKDVTKIGINHTMFWAYRHSQEANTDYLDFSDVIWENDVEEIVKACREEGIRVVTISSAFSSINERLWMFQELGCKIGDMIMVPQRYTQFNKETGEREQAKEPGIILYI